MSVFRLFEIFNVYEKGSFNSAIVSHVIVDETLDDQTDS